MRAPEWTFAGYVFDLGDDLLPGAKETLDELKRLSKVVYLTNKPLEMPADYAAKLTRLGFETSSEEIDSSTDSLLLYLGRHAPRARLFVVGEPPLVELLAAAGYEVAYGAGGVDVVVVSFDYAKLQVAFDAVRAGARIIATNLDAYCPLPGGGGLPDCAAMLAAVEASTGARAEAVVGKPSQHMADALLERLGVPARETLLVGDRLATDMLMAKHAGMSGALVLTGATGLEEAFGSADRPDYILGGLADLLPGSGGSARENREG